MCSINTPEMRLRRPQNPLVNYSSLDFLAETEGGGHFAAKGRKGKGKKNEKRERIGRNEHV